MFRNTRGAGRDPLLPTSGNGRGGGGGLYGSTRSTKPAISKSFLATMIWVLISTALIAGGWMYCSRRMESTVFSCDHKGCKLLETKEGSTTLLNIPRTQLVRAEMVRVKNGEIVDPSGMRRAKQRKLGYSYAIIYTEPDSEDDDDESYDSFEDDDDSYDSYDDDQDSSVDDDDDDEDEVAIIKPAQKKPQAKPSPPKGEKVNTATSSKKFNSGLTPEEKKAAAEARAAKHAEYVKERDSSRARRGMKPIKEPDQPNRPEQRQASRGDTDSEERFPGDAAMSEERNRDQIRSMEEMSGLAKQHKEKADQDYEKAARIFKSNAEMHAQTQQIGNNLQDKKARARASPDDPDNKQRADDSRPGLDRQKFVNDLNAEENDGIETARRRLSSVEDREEEVDGTDRRDIYEDGAERGEGSEHEMQETDFSVSAGAPGGRRRLSWKNRVKQVDTKPAKRTQAEIAADAAKAREAHRRGHGHHQKRTKKVAQTLPDRDGDDAMDVGELAAKAKHHHKAFHHEKDVPEKDRHHIHPGFHHRQGEEKISGGWRHQNKQWHDHRQRKRLGTSYSLGRPRSRARKDMIDSYANRKTHEVEFTDYKKWRAAGIWMIIVGCISMAFSIVVGNFHPRPKTKKVS